jgi:hypothetical protein
MRGILSHGERSEEPRNGEMGEGTRKAKQRRVRDKQSRGAP